MTQAAVVLEDRNAVAGLVAALDGLEGSADGHGRAVGGSDDAAHIVVVHLRREARQLLGSQVERSGTLPSRGVDLGEGTAHVEGLAVSGDAERLDAAVGGGTQRGTLAVSGPDRADAPRRLVVDRRELSTEVEGLTVGGGGDRVDGAVSGGSPVEDFTGVDVVGHRVAARRLVLPGRRARGADRGEPADGVDDVTHHHLVPDNAVDLGGGQGVGGDSGGRTGSTGGGRIGGGWRRRGECDGTKGNKSRGQQAAQESAGELHRYSVQNILRSRIHNLMNGWYSAPGQGRRAGL